MRQPPLPPIGLIRALLPSRAERRRGLLLLGLMAAAAATEGLGLVMAVPLVSALSGGGAQLQRSLPVELGLNGLLIAFVALVSLRALLMQARTMTTQRLQTGVVDSLRSRAWRANAAARAPAC